MTENKVNKKWAIGLSILIVLWAIIEACIKNAKADIIIKNNNCDVEKILVEKSEKKMYLLDCNGNTVKEYDVRLGLDGPKQCEGDKKTPEGTYKIIDKYSSKYHKFLAIDYPRAKDIKKAKELGCKPGNGVGIHAWIKGLPKSNSRGCITVWEKEEIYEINRLVKIGTIIEIRK